MSIGIEQLAINKYDLDNEVVRRADLIAQAGMAAALANSEADQAKDDVKLKEAELAAIVRVNLENNNGKTTEAMVTAGVLVHPDMVKVKKRLIRKQLEAANAEVLFESFKARSYAISDLVELYKAQYFTKDSISDPPSEVVKAKKRK